MNIEQKDIDKVIKWLEIQQGALEHLDDSRTKDLCQVQVTTIATVLSMLKISFEK